MNRRRTSEPPRVRNPSPGATRRPCLVHGADLRLLLRAGRRHVRPAVSGCPGRLSFRGALGVPGVPVTYSEIRVIVHVAGPESPDRYRELMEEVKKRSPVYNTAIHLSDAVAGLRCQGDVSPSAALGHLRCSAAGQARMACPPPTDSQRDQPENLISKLAVRVSPLKAAAQSRWPCDKVRLNARYAADIAHIATESTLAEGHRRRSPRVSAVTVRGCLACICTPNRRVLCTDQCPPVGCSLG